MPRLCKNVSIIVGRRLCSKCEPVTVGEVGGREGVEEEEEVGEVRDFSHFHSSLYAEKRRYDMITSRMHAHTHTHTHTHIL